jgi:hypothetical protein
LDAPNCSRAGSAADEPAAVVSVLYALKALPSEVKGPIVEGVKAELDVWGLDPADVFEDIMSPIALDETVSVADAQIDRWMASVIKTFEELERQRLESGGTDVTGDIFKKAFLNIDGGQLGLALGSVLGRRITSDPFGQVLASATLSTALGSR